jgi:hypothetical protein
MRIKVSICSFLVALMMLAMPAASSAAVIFSIAIAPPPLAVYEQPLCPGVGYIWTPGYWAYSDDGGYFWVPGTWVLVPEPGLLWTPGYWAWSDGFFIFHEGYWGPHVGFYGGINYGFGYFGSGYEGGYWQNGAFFYNRSVNNVTNVTNVYNKTVIVNNTVRNISYNGGEGGITARPTAQEEAVAAERHIPPTPVQAQHVQTASATGMLYEATNHGKPAIAATAKPTEFSSRGVVAAKAAGPSYRPPSARSAGPGSATGSAPRPDNSNAIRPNGNAIHPNDLPPLGRSTPNAGQMKLDRKYQQDQEKLRARQEQERQKLQQKQAQEHQRLEQRRANGAERQQVEQRHQQQTQQLAQKHAQEQQRFQQKLPGLNR